MNILSNIKFNLSRKARRFMASQEGFTLIALLVVVIIMGVLAAVIVPNVARFAQRGQKEAAKTELQNVQTGVDALLAERKIPTNIGDGTVTAGGNVNTTPITDFGLTSAAILAYFSHKADDPPGSGAAVANTAVLYPDYMRQRCASGTPTMASGVCTLQTALPVGDTTTMNGRLGYCISTTGTVTQKVANPDGTFTIGAGSVCT